MWVLKLILTGEDRVYNVIPEKREVTVGRSSADLCLTNDSSISRKHCVLHIAEKVACPAPVPTRTGLWVVDSGSKYGTFVQDPENNTFDKVEQGKPRMLQHGSVIRFGILQLVWSIEYKPIFVCTSVVPTPLKESMRSKLLAIGGDIVSTCDQRCSYLAACSISLTAKVLLAMIHGLPIVKPAFVDQLVEAIRENKPWPDPRQSRPEMAETVLRVEDVDLQPGHKRDSLFKGLKFYVRSAETLAKLEPVITAAGGLIALWDAGDLSKLIQKGAVMVDSCEANFSQTSDTSEVSQTTSQVRGFLERNGRRMVPDREIPLAIAYSSVSHMCNPGFETFSCGPVAAPPVHIPLSQSTVLQEATPRDEVMSRHDIVNATHSRQPDTGFPEPPNQSHPARKRVGSLDIFDDAQSRHKKPAVTSVSPFSVHAINANSKDLVLESPMTAKEDNRLVSSGFLSKSQDQPDGRFGGGLLPKSQMSDTTRNDRDNLGDENPFGKRKARFEEQPSNAAKKSRNYNAILTESSQKKNGSNLEEDPSDILSNRNIIGISNPPPSRNLPSADFECPPLRPPSTVSKPPEPGPSMCASPMFRPADTNPQGWIDMSHRVEPRSPEEALCNTIIMLSMVTLAHAQNQSQPTVAPEGPRNIKVFKKQSFPELNRTVDYQTLPDFQEDWSRITR